MIDLTTLDSSIIGVYFVLIFAVAFFVTRKEKAEVQSDDYF